jgi:hypothetical protein
VQTYEDCVKFYGQVSGSRAHFSEGDLRGALGGVGMVDCRPRRVVREAARSFGVWVLTVLDRENSPMPSVGERSGKFRMRADPAGEIIRF